LKLTTSSFLSIPGKIVGMSRLNNGGNPIFKITYQ